MRTEKNMDVDKLKKKYIEVLSKISSNHFIVGTDLYSGVFLSYPFDDYFESRKKVMVVGRETSGWNTDNGKNKISRVVQFNNNKQLDIIIEESFARYSWHLLDQKGGNYKKKSKSHFQRFYRRVANELELSPFSLIYANLYSWDYNRKTPTKREKCEFEIIRRMSVELLYESINYSKPNVIIFAVGCNKVNDDTIKMLFNDYLGGYQTKQLIRKNYWHFVNGDIDCIRIAHPRANRGEHHNYRSKAIKTIKQKFV